MKVVNHVIGGIEITVFALSYIYVSSYGYCDNCFLSRTVISSNNCCLINDFDKNLDDVIGPLL